MKKGALYNSFNAINYFYCYLLVARRGQVEKLRYGKQGSTI